MPTKRQSLLLVATLLGIALLGWWALEFGAGGEGGGAGRARAQGDQATAGSGAVLTGEEGEAVPARRAAAAVETEGGPQAAAAGPLLTGRVVDTDGRPIAGAQVLVAHTREWGNASLFVEFQAEIQKRYRRFELATGADGRFFGLELRAGPSRVAVRAEGYAPRDLGREVVPARGVLDLGLITLDEGTMLEGRVVDADGRGVAEARITREEKAEGANWGGGGFVPVAVSGADGKFRTSALGPGAWELRVESAGHPTGWFTGTIDTAGISPGHVFQLERAWSIAGRLEVPGVSDLSGYSVRAKYVGARDGLPQHRADALRRAGECASDGSFVVTGLLAVDATTRYELQGRRPGRFARQVGDVVEVPVGSRNVLLRAEPRAGMAFELQDASDGTPIEAPEAWLVIHGGNTIDLVARGSLEQTGPGRYRVRDIVRPSASGSFALRVRKDGYRTATRFALDLEGDVVRDLGVLALERALTLDVEVVDAASGEPVAGAKVVRDLPWKRISADGSQSVVHSDRASVHQRTDESGTVRLPLAPEGANQVAAFHSEYTPAIAEPVLAGSSPGEIRLALTRGASLRVRVEDELGQARAGESVVCRQRDLQQALQRFNPSSRDTTRSALTDRAGEVLFEHLAPGSAEVFRLGGLEEDKRSLVMEDGGAYELTFVAPVRTDLEVLVREAGLPLMGAHVGLWGADDDPERSRPLWHSWQAASATTGADGRARLEGIALGEFDVLVSHPTRDLGSTRAVRIGLDPAPIVVDLSAAGVDGRVMTESGAPAVDCPVFVLAQRDVDDEAFARLFRSADDSRFPPNTVGAGQGRTDADGRYRFRGLAEDEPLVVVAIGADAVPVVSTPFTLASDEVRELEALSTQAAGALAVRIQTAKGYAGAYRVQVEALGEGAGPLARHSARFSSAGLATVRHLARGEWRVRLVRSHGPQDPFDEEVVRVNAGEQSELELRAPH